MHKVFRIEWLVGLLFLALLSVTPTVGHDDDSEPCFNQVTISTLQLAKSPTGLLLSWSAEPGAAWYEVMRCTGQPDDCELVSLAPHSQTSFEDNEVPGDTYVGYRIAAIIDPADNGCSQRTYCSIPVGQCGGQGQCSLHCEICVGPFEPVCGCDGNTKYNGCKACEEGVNIRHDGVCNP